MAGKSAVQSRNKIPRNGMVKSVFLQTPNPFLIWPLLTWMILSKHGNMFTSLAKNVATMLGHYGRMSISYVGKPQGFGNRVTGLHAVRRIQDGIVSRNGLYSIKK